LFKVSNANGKTRLRMQNGDTVRLYVELKRYKQNGENRNCLEVVINRFDKL
jgi:hypothetical protein